MKIDKKELIMRWIGGEQQRPCDGCTACCRYPGIAKDDMEGKAESDKPAGAPCEHCTAGSGCAIYDERPTLCSGYRCLWSAGMLPIELQPEAVQCAFTLQPTGHQRGQQQFMVMGHTADTMATLRSDWFGQLVRHVMDGWDIFAVTLRDSQYAASVVRYANEENGDMAIYRAKVDPKDPRRIAVLEETEETLPNDTLHGGSWKVDQRQNCCGQCPYSKSTPKSYLDTRGDNSEKFVGQAMGNFLLPCHMEDKFKDWGRPGVEAPRCAGAAKYRANIGVHGLAPTVGSLPEDTENVWASAAELFAHHKGWDVERAIKYLDEVKTPREMHSEQKRIVMSGEQGKIIGIA